MIQATDKKIDDCVTKLASLGDAVDKIARSAADDVTKLAYIVDAVDKIARSAADAPSTPATPNTEGSTRVAGKRKATK